ncbi:MAG: DNRLRE domain-containing protein [Ignavibacteria bacterium]|nr:DNRLRE domain-containing protein [Ignavibacteria bacterium]
MKNKFQSSLPLFLKGLPMFLLLTFFSFNESKSQTTINITLAKDNTLYEDISGTTSNGAGQYFFAGKTAVDLVRRGLIKFDLSAIPSCATITAVTLKLHLSKTISGIKTVQLRKVSQDWGEGASAPGGEEGFGAFAEAGDATWVYSFYDTVDWERDGGVFSNTSSASLGVGGVGFYTWGSTSQMINDVQSWKNNPSNNFGWLLLGDESSTASAKRFDTHENITSANRPVLTVTYTTNSLSLNLTSFIEGFWNGTSMVKDTAKVYLRNSAPPYAIVDFSKAELNSNGIGNYCFFSAAGGSYYIVVDHRNSIDTWSNTPQTFAPGVVKVYNFSTAANKAYGNNEVLKLSKYCIYGGDVNKDGIVDAGDISAVDNDASIALSGYVITDLTGDDFVDSGDVSIVENNSFIPATVMNP